MKPLARKAALLPAANAQRLLIYGPVGCGKGSLARFLAPNAAVLNAADLRFCREQIAAVDASECIILQANSEVFAAISPQSAKRYIITHNAAFLSAKMASASAAAGFFSLQLDFLDYEEFCSFKNNARVGEYLLAGRSPAAVLGQSDGFLRQQNLRAMLGEKQLRLLAWLATLEGSFTSRAKLYAARPSAWGKADFYAAIERFCELGLLANLPVNESSERLFLADFGLRAALSESKNFPATFASACAAELKSQYADLRAHKLCDFYSPSASVGVIAQPFFDANLSPQRLKQLAKLANSLKLRTILILNLSEFASWKISNVRIIALGLENYLLSKDEPLEQI